MTRRRNQKGNTFVEFALAVTILVPIFTGAFQYGYTFYVYNELVNAVRDGARNASYRKLSNAGDGTTPTAFSTAVKNVVVYGNNAGTGNPVVPNLTTTNVSVAATFDADNVPTDVTVGITGYTVNGLFGSVTFNKPTLKMPYLGTYCATGTSC